MSNIEWTEKTWNPTTGCTEVSPGCRDCYAKNMAWRHIHNPKTKKDYEGTAGKVVNGKIVWTGKINLLEHRLLEPVLTKKPTTWFVDSMSDLFHEDVPFSYIDKVFAVMMLCPQHIFQVLTKRTARMLEYCMSRQDFDYIDEAAAIIVMETPHLFHVLEKASKEQQEFITGKHIITNELLPHLKNAGWFWDTIYFDSGDGDISKDNELICEGDFPSKHIWLGTSIENQKTANDRGKPLFDLHNLGWVTWVSNEPAIGPVNWEEPFFFGFLDWMVTGGESGSTARPMHPDWAQASRDFCEKNKIPFFFKQWGSWAEWIPEFPAQNIAYLSAQDAAIGYNNSYVIRNGKNEIDCTAAPMVKVGKHAAGRLLDGKLHDAYPVIRNSQFANETTKIQTL